MKIKKDKIKEKRKNNKEISWIIKIFFVALILSFSFSLLSELIFSTVGIIVSIIVIIVLLAIGVIFDMIGVAVTSADLKPFTSMMSRKVRGAKQGMKLIKNAEKVSSICNDVVGDICGILTGAAGTVIALKIITNTFEGIEKILITSAVSAIIAGLTILGKACFKKVAMIKSTSIVMTVGKFLSVFSWKKKNKTR